ncbi:MAG: proline dehydrogenase family protein [Anaerolineae bacterium]|nr:proline dehydrogenase family protein [Anaerolineae bacterium]
MLRNILLKLSTSDTARQIISHFGPARRVARRFVAGETLDEAVAVTRSLNRRGIKAILNEVGEEVASKAEAVAAARSCQVLLQRIEAEKLDATISLKPSHVGLAFGPDFCYENIAGVVQAAQTLGITVEIDMEHSADVDDTLAIYHRLLDTFGEGIRQALQAYLYRTSADLQRIIARGGGVRLVKGAYRESKEIAYQGKKDIWQAAKVLIVQCFTPEARKNRLYLALGSHDPALIEWLIQIAETRKISRSSFEFQMLLGVRHGEQQRLADLGYQVRVYVPYGRAWYPYYMRRMAEYPANVWLIGRAMFEG